LKIDAYNITVGNATDIGQVRKLNEDYMAHFDTPYGYCVIVCDGMGGHAAGDVASQGAVEAIKHYLQDGKITKLDAASSLHNAIEFANYKLREMVQQNPELAGMGTTCVMVLISKSEMHMAHAGDSRVYLIRDKHIRQLSKDHSTIQNLIDTGILTEEEAKESEKRNQITKAIGIFEKVSPTVTKVPFMLKYNDRILLCSDGLTGHVESNEILDIINDNSDVQVASIKLVEKANLDGGSDNITVQVIHYAGSSLVIRTHRPLKRILRIVAIVLIISALGFAAYSKWGSLLKHEPIMNDTIQSSGKIKT
jgi:serine/threonine protein phosphatase PrpC